MIIVAAVVVLLLLVIWFVGMEVTYSKIRFAKQLGSGINLGNSLDATGVREYKPETTDLEYEVAWGNPKISGEQFAAIRNAGFSSVRIPVTWQDHMDKDGVVSVEWMERVNEVVDLALQEDLYVILDTHHEAWLDLEPAKAEEICDAYRRIWQQIAEQFREYDEHLLFEGMNEPRLRDSEHEWDEGTPQMRAMVNRLNEVFVDTVRQTGGNNEKRYLLICAYASNTEEEALMDLVVPDGNIIVSVHMYLPYSFCQDEDGTASWSKIEGESVMHLEEVFGNLERLYIRRHIPVVITEFGCKDKGNTAERVAWIEEYRRRANELGIPCFWWDNGSSYQLLDRDHVTWTYPEIVEALVK